MQESDIKETFARLNIFKRRAYEAPHKALMLMLMLGRCWHCQERLIDFQDVVEPFRDLLARFGHGRNPREAALYPFWALHSEKCNRERLWELRSVKLADSIARGAKGRPTFAVMLRSDLRGGLSEPLHRIAVHNKFLLLQLALVLLDRAFPKHLHAEILQAVGIPDHEPAKHRAFRQAVLQTYRYSCAVCSFGGKVGDQHIGVHVAHIKWPNAGGPDVCANALALCGQHRELFDIGAFTLSESSAINVSAQFAEPASESESNLHNMAGRPIAAPARVVHRPRREFLQWHRRHVYLSS